MGYFKVIPSLSVHYGLWSLGRGSVSKIGLFMMFFDQYALILMEYDWKDVPGSGQVPVLDLIKDSQESFRLNCNLIKKTCEIEVVKTKKWLQKTQNNSKCGYLRVVWGLPRENWDIFVQIMFYDPSWLILASCSKLRLKMWSFISKNRGILTNSDGFSYFLINF